MSKKNPNNKKKQRQILNKKIKQQGKSQKAKKQQAKAQEKLKKLNKQEQKQFVQNQELLLQRQREEKQQQQYTNVLHTITATNYIKYLSKDNYGTDDIPHYIDPMSYEYIRELQNGGYKLIYKGLKPERIRVIPKDEKPSEHINRKGNLYAIMITSVNGRGQRLNTWALDPKVEVKRIPDALVKTLLKTTEDESYDQTFDKIDRFYNHNPSQTIGFGKIYIQLLGYFFEEGASI